MELWSTGSRCKAPPQTVSGLTLHPPPYPVWGSRHEPKTRQGLGLKGTRDPLETRRQEALEREGRRRTKSVLRETPLGPTTTTPALANPPTLAHLHRPSSDRPITPDHSTHQSTVVVRPPGFLQVVPGTVYISPGVYSAYNQGFPFSFMRLSFN